MSVTASTVIARCLLDPAFLGRMTTDRAAALEGYMLDDRTRADFLDLDISKVRAFAGFITKVQHNYLWQSFPYLRALLKFYGIEIQVFAEYHGQHMRLRVASAPRDQRISAFLWFLRDYLDGHDDSGWLGLRDIVEHERMVWEIRCLLAGGPGQRPMPSRIDTSSLRWRVLESLVPSPSTVRCGRFTYDPLRIVADLNNHCFRTEDLIPSPRWLAYCGESSEQIRILELDDFSVILLSEVNGRRTIRSIVERVRKQVSPLLRPSECRAFFDAAFQARLLTLPERPINRMA